MKRAGKMSRRRYSLLVSAVMVGIMSITPYVSAEDTDYLATEYIEYDGRNVAELNFLAKDQGIGKEKRWLINPSRYDMSDDLIEATVDATTYWTDMLGDGLKNDEPWQIFIDTNYARNASASSPNIKSNGVRPAYNSYYNGESFVRHQLQYGDKLEELTIDKAETGVLPVGNYGYSNITVGYAFGAFRQGAIDGWWVDNDTVLPTNEFAADYVGTIRHELGHALGIHAAKRTRRGNTFFHPGLNDETSWSLQLRDQNGNKAKAGMQIVTSATFEKMKAKNPSLSADDYFIVDDEVTADGKGYAYFSGKNVVDALGGATFFGRSAVPVNGWERRGFEGSHIQTAGMMSHRDYSNYTSFLEVELAAMQDLGYKIDRRAYFGRSIYGNGGTINNTQGYFARNDAGTAYVNDTFSKTPLGIGLHIYGYGNTVTQNADILTKGAGATGVRIDGMTNTLIIPKDTEIHADGNRGNGVLIAYGRNQIVEQAGTVTANGNDGVGMRFDFGSSTNGASDEYRGSYIRYNRWVNSYNTGADAGTISSAENYKLTDLKVDGYSAGKDELEGPLVDDYNLSGKLVGSDAAIYIGKNAFVKNININEGASIKGDIVSEWKQFYKDSCEEAYDGDGNKRDVLRIQYNGNYAKNGYEYNKYIPDLVTNLNFNNEMKYDGDILGADNIKLNVTGETLIYSGEADVINVSVDDGAELFGGTYNLTDLSGDIATGFEDNTTGNFYNYGTIGAANQDSNMTINGNLVSDGILSGYTGGTKGQIVVSGTADVEGSMVSVNNALPGTEMTVLKAGSIKGTIGNADKPYEVSGMLNATGTVSGTELKVQTVAANNMGQLDSNQQTAFDAMTDMQQQLAKTGDQRVEDMRQLYGMGADEAKGALSALGSSTVADIMAMAQSNTMTSHIISARLAEAFALKDTNVTLPGAGLDSGASANDATVKMKLDQPVDNDFWFKTMRNWGDGTGSSYYQGTTLAGGWDRAYGKNWRAGAFISYGQTSFADSLSHNNLKDTRLGLYGGYSKGAHSGFVYLDYGRLNNDLTRNLTGLNMRAQAEYSSRLLELGGEYKYDLNAYKTTPWHISPYANMQLSRLSQDGYAEQNAGIFGQRVNSKTNTYFAGGVGMEFKRYLPKGSYELRLGIKHAFSGADPRLTYGYVGNEASSYEMRGQQDKTHFIMSLGGEAEFAPGWTLAGDLSYQKGSHDKDVMAVVTLRRMW